MSYNSGVIMLEISNHSPHYSLNCTPLSPITITNNNNDNSNSNDNNNNNDKGMPLRNIEDHTKSDGQ